MAENNNDRKNRVASSVGRGIVRFIGLYIVAPLVVVYALFFIALPKVGDQLLNVPGSILRKFTGPKLPPKDQLDEANRLCALVAAYHDGRTEIERLGAAMAHINLAKASGLTVAEVYNDFGTLKVPEDDLTAARSCTADRLAYGWSSAQKGKWSAGVIALDNCLRDREACFKKHPWLKCVQFEIRNTWEYSLPFPDTRFRTDKRFVRVYPENPKSGDAEFFCLK